MSQFINLIWSTFDYVWKWLQDMYSSFDVDIEVLILGALIIAGIMGYILSPYLHNPIPSADHLRKEDRIRKERAERRAERNARKR